MYTLLIGKPPFETNDVKTTYRRIKMNFYSFPEHINISIESKDLIERILITDPTARPSLSDIEKHPFFAKNLIPKLLPKSTLAVPPTQIYIKQFEKNPSLRPLSRGRDSSVGKTPRSNSHKDEERSRNKKEEIKPKSRGSSRERNLSGSESPTRKNATTSIFSGIPDGPKVWVKKWVNYSNKYGIGYMLSNGSAGVYFNDSTKIICDKDGTSFQYINNDQSNYEGVLHSFANYPIELQKKVTLLMHFRKHLNSETNFEYAESQLSFVKK